MTSNDTFTLEYRSGHSELVQKIDVLGNNTERRFDVIEHKLDALDRKVEALTIQVHDNSEYFNMRIDSVQTSVYWGFALMGIFIAVAGVMAALAPSILEIVRNRHKEQKYVTFEQVQELINQAMSKDVQAQ